MEHVACSTGTNTQCPSVRDWWYGTAKYMLIPKATSRCFWKCELSMQNRQLASTSVIFLLSSMALCLCLSSSLLGSFLKAVFVSITSSTVSPSPELEAGVNLLATLAIIACVSSAVAIRSCSIKSFRLLQAVEANAPGCHGHGQDE